MDQQKIGTFLKQLRQERQLTQENLAEIMCVTNRSVSRWENGVNLPDLPTLIQLADFYGVELRELLDGERKPDAMNTPETKSATEETARRGKKALQEAKDYFRPELMGRLDDVVLFDPLGPAQLAAIADRLLCELEERAARQGYTLRHTPAAAAALAGDTVPAYGARELRRKVSRAVEQALADRIAAGTARPGVLFVADAAPDGHITLTMGDVAACAS